MTPPWIFSWLAWCFLWYWPSLMVCIALTAAHKAYDDSRIRYSPALITGWHDIVIMAFVAFCFWVVVCAIRNGYGVG